jgi:carbohydrate esterase-like protein/GDSL-like lipase/acylhydrolase family protein
MNARALGLLVTLGWAVAACGPSFTTMSTATTGADGGIGAGSAGTGGASPSSSTSPSTSSSGGGSATGGDEPLAEVHFLGRFDLSDPQVPAFSWPGTTIVTRFSGTGLDVNLHDDGHNFFAVSIDGAAPTVLPTDGAKDTYSLAQGLPDGAHDAVLSRRTESFQGIVHFHGFTPTGGKALIPTPAPFLRRIELIGDSITCGYGNDGVGPNCGFTPATENAWLSYGSVAARALKAEARLIAYSGKGVYRDGVGNTKDQMGELYGRTSADIPGSTWDFSAWTADVVVVNLGTNDFGPGDPGQPYVDAYTALVKQIRGHYPKAHILCAVGSMMVGQGLTQATSYTKSVVSAANAGGDPRVSFVDLGVQDGNADGYGCDWHPSAQTDQLMADKLAAAIKAVAGW